jgi:hypothetical protein
MSFWIKLLWKFDVVSRYRFVLSFVASRFRRGISKAENAMISDGAIESESASQASLPLRVVGPAGEEEEMREAK